MIYLVWLTERGVEIIDGVENVQRNSSTKEYGIQQVTSGQANKFKRENSRQVLGG